MESHPFVHALTSLEVGVAIVPLVLAMLFVRWWEKRSGVPRYEKLGSGERAWLFVSCLLPCNSALILEGMAAREAWAYRHLGCSLLPRASELSARVFEEFLRACPDDWVGSGGDLEWAESTINQLVAERRDDVVRVLRELWPLDATALAAADAALAAGDAGASVAGDVASATGDVGASVADAPCAEVGDVASVADAPCAEAGDAAGVESASAVAGDGADGTSSGEVAVAGDGVAVSAGEVAGGAVIGAAVAGAGDTAPVACDTAPVSPE